MIVHTSAIVLKSFPYGDTSLIAQCFSKDKGKIGVIIKGARTKKKPKTPGPKGAAAKTKTKTEDRSTSRP